MLKKRINLIKSDSLSTFRTFHEIENYGEIYSIDDYKFYIDWAKRNNKKIFFLGNGSNTLFMRKKVKSLVLKNKLPKEIKCISQDKGLFEISSSTMVHEVLKYCFNNSLDSFYYLASVPATIGGALAMNAGMAKYEHNTIYDFVQSVKYIDSDKKIKEINVDEMKIQHRKTMFTGCQEKFIISAIFKFPKKDFGNNNPIKERILWAKKYQDNTAPNCGSIFSECSGVLLRRIKGLKVGNAKYSSKTTNWINNYSKSPYPILVLIAVGKILHIFFLQKSKIELVLVK